MERKLQQDKIGYPNGSIRRMRRERRGKGKRRRVDNWKIRGDLAWVVYLQL